MERTSRLITAPPDEPVTLTEAKAHLRLETDDDDTTVTALISAARQWAEEHCWRGFVTQTWELVLSEFPGCDSIELPRGQLASITSITYVDAEGDEQALSTDTYEADTDNVPGRARLKYGQSWPSTRDQYDAVRIRYVVGVAAAAVPTPVKQAVLLLVSEMYENRTPTAVGVSVGTLPFAAQSLLSHYRLLGF